jgi:hypothetical protein
VGHIRAGHVLACEGHSWCSNGHIEGWVLAVVVTGIVLLVLGAGRLLNWLERRSSRR